MTCIDENFLPRIFFSRIFLTMNFSQTTVWDLQQFMSEQIDLHVFKVITAASCVDIIVNKRLNKYN